jgi:hypothetical protein
VIAANVPFAWVAPATYGVSEIELTLRRACKGFDGVDAPDGISMPEWWCCNPLEEASVNQVIPSP